MATLSTRDFTTLVRSMTAAIQARASSALDLSVGSVLRALVEAVSGLALWLESLVLAVLALTRAATSAASDLDSWMADYGVTRLAAAPAGGSVAFARFTATNQATIPVGTLVKTADGTQSFAVTIDTGNAAYSAALGAYVLAAGVSSLSVPVSAVIAGTAGNVLAGTVTTISAALPGIDTVTNPAAFTGGIDAESDAALRARFVLYIGSLSKATAGAVGSAIANIQQGLNYRIVENQDYNGATDDGYFYVVVDDGTGYPSSTLLSTVNNAIDAARALGVRFGVFAPVVVTADVTMALTSAAGTTHADVVAAVTTALQTAIDALPLGTSLPYTQLAAIAYGVTGVANVTGILLNGATADLAATVQQVVKAGTMVIS
jgi:uncharacterized phage protein gp47/JayE